MLIKSTIKRIIRTPAFWAGMLCMLAFFVCIFIARSAVRYYRLGELRHVRHLNAATDIQTWMTFDFINTAFKLPSDYLKNELRIEDARYPRLTIARYVKSYHLDSTVFMHQLRESVEKAHK